MESLRDLSDPSAGRHAMQILLADLRTALLTTSPTHLIEYRGPRVVSIADNYDALRIAPEAVTRDRRYTRYVTEGTVLRTHTSAMIPRLLRDLAKTLRLTVICLTHSGPIVRIRAFKRCALYATRVAFARAFWNAQPAIGVPGGRSNRSGVVFCVGRCAQS